MKKIAILSVLLLFFAACSSSSDEAEEPKIDNKEDKVETIKINGHDFVDLGLPSGTLWACTNVGATTPYDDGDYFAWGEIEPKDIYGIDNYKWGTPPSPSKYNEIDGKVSLDAEDDVATVKWGSECCMPSKDEIQEICERCTWTWKSNYNGSNGYFVKGPNGKHIFLPATGTKDELGFNGHGWRADYLSKDRSLKCGLDMVIYTLYISDDLGYQINDFSARSQGNTVRPVAKSNSLKEPQ